MLYLDWPLYIHPFNCLSDWYVPVCLYILLMSTDILESYPFTLCGLWMSSEDNTFLYGMYCQEWHLYSNILLFIINGSYVYRHFGIIPFHIVWPLTMWKEVKTIHFHEVLKHMSLTYTCNSHWLTCPAWFLFKGGCWHLRFTCTWSRICRLDTGDNSLHMHVIQDMQILGIILFPAFSSIRSWFPIVSQRTWDAHLWVGGSFRAWDPLVLPITTGCLIGTRVTLGNCQRLVVSWVEFAIC